MGLKFYCRSHWLVDLVLSGFNTPYQIYRTKFIEYLKVYEYHRREVLGYSGFRPVVGIE